MIFSSLYDISTYAEDISDYIIYRNDSFCEKFSKYLKCFLTLSKLNSKFSCVLYYYSLYLCLIKVLVLTLFQAVADENVYVL